MCLTSSQAHNGSSNNAHSSQYTLRFHTSQSDVDTPRTLTTQNFNAHARVLVPVDCVEFDEAQYDWLIEVRVFYSI